MQKTGEKKNGRKKKILEERKSNRNMQKTKRNKQGKRC